MSDLVFGRVCLVAIGTTLGIRFSLAGIRGVPSLGMPEAIIFVGVAISIVGHWSFTAWLKHKERKPEDNGEFETLAKDVKEVRAKVNAIILRTGLG